VGEIPDAVLLIHDLNQLPDADAVHRLRHLAAGAGKVLVVEDTFDISGTIDEHAAENDVLSLAAWGSGFRTGTELATVFADAGVTVTVTGRFGWDRTVYTVV
jgi:hypothetical protein